MIRVVIADDSSQTTLIVSECLKMQAGFEVVKTFNSGKSLLSFLESNQVDLLMLDIVMPEVDGFKVLEDLASKKEKPFASTARISIDRRCSGKRADPGQVLALAERPSASCK